MATDEEGERSLTAPLFVVKAGNRACGARTASLVAQVPFQVEPPASQPHSVMRPWPIQLERRLVVAPRIDLRVTPRALRWLRVWDPSNGGRRLILEVDRPLRGVQ